MSKIYRMNTNGQWQEIGLDKEYVFTDRSVLSVDKTFKSGNGPSRSDEIFIDVDSKGRIYVQSHGGTYNDETISYAPVYRLNADGTLDQSFSLKKRDFISLPSRDGDYFTQITADGKLVMIGYSSNIFYGETPATPSYGPFKFNEDGTIDGEFMRSINTGFASPAYEFVIDSAGDFIVHCASPNSFNGQPVNTNLVKIYYDSEYEEWIIYEYPSIHNYRQLKSVQIPITNPKTYNTSYTYDEFTIKGIDNDDSVYISVRPDRSYYYWNNLWLSEGNFGYSEYTVTTYGEQRTYGQIIKIDSGGGLLSGFTLNATPIDNLNSDFLHFKIKENKKIVLSDSSLYINSTPTYKIIQINDDGTVDQTFISNLQKDPTVHLSLNVTEIDDLPPYSQSSILVSSTPSVPYGEEYDPINSLDVLQNKIIFTKKTKESPNFEYFVRLNDDGSYDKDFSLKTIFIHGEIEKILHQPINGKIIIHVNKFTSTGYLNNIPLNTRLFRINPDNIISQDIVTNIDESSKLYPLFLIGE